MLVGLLLPVALLTATVWRQKVPLTSWSGWSLASLVLVGTTIVAHMAIDNVLSWRQHGRWLAAAALALLVAGMALLAATGTITDLRGRRAFLLAALGLVMLSISRGLRRPAWSSDRGRRSMQ
jgi:hypothetical protein